MCFPFLVCKEPPYKVEESGYAGFIMPIEVYFKNKVGSPSGGGGHTVHERGAELVARGWRVLRPRGRAAGVGRGCVDVALSSGRWGPGAGSPPRRRQCRWGPSLRVTRPRPVVWPCVTGPTVWQVLLGSSLGWASRRGPGRGRVSSSRWPVA